MKIIGNNIYAISGCRALLNLLSMKLVYSSSRMYVTISDMRQKPTTPLDIPYEHTKDLGYNNLLP